MQLISFNIKCFVQILFQSLLFLFASSAYSTYVPKMNANELFEKTALVFEGVVLSVDTYAAQGRRPSTKVTFSVIEVLYGSHAEPEITFDLPIGELPNGKFFTIAGMPFFYEGEKYILFIRDGEWNITPITNWHHSFFRNVKIDDEIYYVTDQGRGVDGWDEKGVVVGEKITNHRPEKSKIKHRTKKEKSLKKPKFTSSINSKLFKENLNLYIKKIKYRHSEKIKTIKFKSKRNNILKSKPVKNNSKNSIKIPLLPNHDAGIFEDKYPVKSEMKRD